MSVLISFFGTYRWYIIAALATGFAFLCPMTIWSMFLGWVAAASLVAAVGEKSSVYRGLASYGVIISFIGFYWLPDTLSRFGGFHYSISLLLFALFALVSTIQFFLCAWLYLRLKDSFVDKASLALPLAWVVAEFLVPRMFPWALSHTQIVWSSFASLAEISGPYLLSGFMLWWFCMIHRFLNSPSFVGTFVLSLAVGGVLIMFGFWRVKDIELQISREKPVTIGMVQGNLSIQEKGKVSHLKSNIQRYRELSNHAVNEGAELLIWPESVVSNWMDENVATIAGSENDPLPGASVPLLYGGLSFAQRDLKEYEKIINSAFGDVSPQFSNDVKYKKYNSAFLRTPAGIINGRYHKRVLMPLGEYLPFSHKFPFVRDISPHSGDFESGEILDPITVKVKSKLEDWPKKKTVLSRKIKLMPLICYEDLISDLALDAARRGAHFLVNLTNDAWYGETAAPKQHHLLAAWRAIETRRYLLRVTNTGFTAVVDPLGKTLPALPIFEEGVMTEKVHILDETTPYVLWGNTLLWLMTALAFFLSLSSSRE